MYDPQDLLYTNNFASTTVLSDKSVIDETKYYDRFKKYIEEDIDTQYEKFIDDNENETNQINLNKTLYKKWPVDSKKNHYPLFDTYTNDISVNRYKKQIITKVNIDTINRDYTKYISPNNFAIPFQKVFNNIKKIVLNDINIKNTIQSVSNYNNNLSWQYASQNYLVTNNIDTSIIPVPIITRFISYSNLPNAVYKYTTNNNSSYIIEVDNYLVYQTNINPGFYSIKSLVNNIRTKTSLITHGKKLYKTLNILEEPYLAYPKKQYSPHLFSCDINPHTNIVKFVNRIEEINIIAIQTFSPYELNYQNIDIFYYYSSLYSSTNPYILNNNYIYIILPAYSETTYQYYYNLNNVISPNPFPLVITDLKNNIGGINYDLINYTTFFDLNIYLNNGYKENELSSISYYKYIDTINIHTTKTINGNSITVNNTYLRFGLHLSSGLLSGNPYNNTGNLIKPSFTNNYLYSNTLNSYFNNLNLYTIYEYIDNFSLIGRALLFRWIYDKYDNNYINYEIESLNEKKRTILHILGWIIPNETFQIYNVEINKGFAFVQNNKNITYLSENNLTNFSNKGNNYSTLDLNLQNYNNEYYFVDNSYIYIKINFNNMTDYKQTRLFISALSDQNLQYNQTYVAEELFNVGIGEDYTSILDCSNITVYTKDNTGIFAKLLLSNNPGNFDILTSNINNNNFVINYDTVQDNVSSVTIQILDSNFRILQSYNNYSFTMEIHEIHDILKETLINTKTNSVNSTGHFI
jgi:hypothetical protein